MTERAAELAGEGVPFVRATVVRAQHPTSVHAGDAALVHADGTIEGFVGGVCTEAAVREHALLALERRAPLVLRIVAEGEERTEPDRVTVANPCLSGGSVELFLEPRQPGPRLVVFGDSPVTRALERLAEPLGLRTARGGDSTIEPDDAAVVVASHGRGERAALEAALRAGVDYVGLVASRRRGASVLAALDVDDDQRARVRSPAGLDLGARTAGEIALTILAELVQQRAWNRDRQASTSVTVEEALTAATAIDPVCGMSVQPGTSTPSVERDGVTQWFCAEGCRDRFTADPDRYAA